MDDNKIDIRSMALHQRENIDYSTSVTRVVGGWIYETFVDHNGSTVSTCFVPMAQDLLSDWSFTPYSHKQNESAF